MNVVKEITRIRRVAKDLEDQGYVVSIEPDQADIPFALGGYRPDILARRGDEYVIVEVKSTRTRGNVDRYKDLIETIRQHPGWRFMVSTIDETGTAPEESAPGPPEDIESIRRLLERLEPLLEGGNYDLTFPFLWSGYIGALRTAAQRRGMSADAYSDLSLINYMYSLGELSNQEYEESKRLLRIRNDAVHAINVRVSRADVAALRDLLGRILGRLGEQ